MARGSLVVSVRPGPGPAARSAVIIVIGSYVQADAAPKGSGAHSVTGPVM